jgi:Ferritin-like domain
VRRPVMETAVDGRSRRCFLCGGLAGAAALAGVVSGLGRPAAAQAPSAEQDERILNFLLGLEYVQSAFYAQAGSGGALSGELAEFAQVAGEHEQRHVERLRELLGDAAQDEPELDLGEAVSHEESFLEAAVTLEDTGVSAYIGQAANLTIEAVAAVAPIVSVEARHTAWILAVAGRHPAPLAADPAASASGVTSTLERAGLALPGS